MDFSAALFRNPGGEFGIHLLAVGVVVGESGVDARERQVLVLADDPSGEWPRFERTATRWTVIPVPGAPTAGAIPPLASLTSVPRQSGRPRGRLYFMCM
jgi:hypothetical protein